MNVALLEPINADCVADHVFELLVTHAPPANSDLGTFLRKDGQIVVELRVPSERKEKKEKKKKEKKQTDNVEFLQLAVTQNMSLFTSNRVASTTGAMLWRVSVLFAEWVLGVAQGRVVDRYVGENGDQSSDSDCTKIFTYPLSEWDVVELGCGSAGLLCSALGAATHSYLATDHLPALIKSCERNVRSNVPHKYLDGPSAVDDEGPQKIRFMEYDWEDPARGLDAVRLAIDSGDDDDKKDRPLVVIACDTIYNDHLIPHFLEAAKRVCGLRPANSCLVVAQQVRDSDIMEEFMEQLVDLEGEVSFTEQSTASSTEHHQDVDHQDIDHKDIDHQDTEQKIHTEPPREPTPPTQEPSVPHKAFDVFAVPDNLLSTQLVHGYTVHFAKYKP